MAWVNGHGCQRACSYWYYAAVAEMLVALRSLRPGRQAVLFVSVLTSRIAGYVTRTSGGVGGGSCEAHPYPDRRRAAQRLA